MTPDQLIGYGIAGVLFSVCIFFIASAACMILGK